MGNTLGAAGGAGGTPKAGQSPSQHLASVLPPPPQQQQQQQAQQGGAPGLSGAPLGVSPMLSGQVSSPSSIGSPLSYGPQMSLLGSARPVDGSSATFSGATTWPATPKMMPVVIVWSHGGGHVEVEGSFDNWSTRQILQRTGKDYTIIKLLPPGVYQYKFIVDGEWKYDPNQPAMFDEMGNVNNVLEVHEYVPENLDGLSGFEPPPSPPSSYNNPPPVSEDFAKEPPAMPPHLQLTLLNLSPTADTHAVLPRPQHVILNHLYCQRGQNVNALVVGTTHRYKSKYITTVMYKPRTKTAEPGHHHTSG